MVWFPNDSQMKQPLMNNISKSLHTSDKKLFMPRYILFHFSHTGEDINSLQWRHNGQDGVPNHQPLQCLLNRLFGCRSKKTSKLCVPGLCAGISPVTGEFPAQMASSVENVSIWWRHHVSRTYPFTIIVCSGSSWLQYCDMCTHSITYWIDFLQNISKNSQFVKWAFPLSLTSLSFISQ